ncbi:LysR family transcriptional regulator [Pseudooceanicola sp. CBS1P-1]|uniref:LysR family transcriptional regulator n=1 Tax=Pseudooceanicola albus TaxID=2692189 RepID=A0A6L7G881_9RHOB|nr:MULTISPECIES: LysR family transcriptional regulator [Pseudooceanicola]MBT9385258.1 LysR family transcriptional regulator [Pseudooceanicola endophyticus]MXN18883.1 LysR family transcriptional regulator [Pseudooceanicola albus]
MGHFDLNLVRVFLAIWDHRSVTAAAERLQLTQPAVSQSLRRLRDLYADPLFLRVGNVMEPTQKAQALWAPLRAALDAISATVLQDREFDPAVSDRRFRVTMSDIAEVNLLPRLAAMLERQAPRLQLDVSRMEPGQVATQLRAGLIDIALGHVPDLCGPEIRSVTCWSDSYVCLMSESHPLAGRSVTPADFARLRFVDTASQAPGFQRIRRALADMNLERQVVMTTDLYAAVPEILRRTGLVALYPYSAALQANAHGDFYLSPLPGPLPPAEIAAHHHAKFDTDPGIRWLHGAIVSVLSSLAPPPFDPEATRSWN